MTCQGRTDSGVGGSECQLDRQLNLSGRHGRLVYQASEGYWIPRAIIDLEVIRGRREVRMVE